MNRLRLLLFCLLAVAPVAAASAASHSTGAWHTLPKAPIVPDDGGVASVWTGKEMLVFGRHHVTALDARGNPYVAKRLKVPKAARKRRQNCGKETVFQNRLRWARWELKREGIIETTRRGYFRLK